MFFIAHKFLRNDPGTNDQCNLSLCIHCIHCVHCRSPEANLQRRTVAAPSPVTKNHGISGMPRSAEALQALQAHGALTPTMEQNTDPGLGPSLRFPIDDFMSSSTLTLLKLLEGVCPCGTWHARPSDRGNTDLRIQAPPARGHSLTWLWQDIPELGGESSSKS